MPDYTLHYWPIPFRGQFVRAALAQAGASWEEADPDEVARLRAAAPADQPAPHMGPPVLVDHGAGTALAQMPAILDYLGRRHGLTPQDPYLAALTAKLVADASDILYEMTRHHGAQMWTAPAWRAYRPRLARWMAIFEETGRRHGLTGEGGHLLGTPGPTLADLAAATLWGTMTAKLPALRPLLDAEAPAVAALTDRIGALPAQAELRRQSDAAWGEAWCGGEIEASLREALDATGHD